MRDSKAGLLGLKLESLVNSVFKNSVLLIAVPSYKNSQLSLSRQKITSLAGV